MSNRPLLFALAAIGLWLTGAAPSQAATVTEPGPQTGISYEHQVVMGDLDLAHYHGEVGAKSWAEPGQAVGNKGWTHTTSWTALDLTGISGPVQLNVDLERGHGAPVSQLLPAFTLYKGWETAVNDSTHHTFNNTGLVDWAPNLTEVIGFVANAGGPNGTASGTGSTSVSGSWTLGPGLYSLVYGGNPAYPPAQSGFHTFSATLFTAPVPVPAALWLFGSGLAGMVGLARRRMTV